eukprot:g67305.t1
MLLIRRQIVLARNLQTKTLQLPANSVAHYATGPVRHNWLTDRPVDLSWALCGGHLWRDFSGGWWTGGVRKLHHGAVLFKEKSDSQGVRGQRASRFGEKETVKKDKTDEEKAKRAAERKERDKRKAENRKSQLEKQKNKKSAGEGSKAPKSKKQQSLAAFKNLSGEP